MTAIYVLKGGQSSIYATTQNKSFPDGTLGGIRTHTLSVLSRFPLPIGVREHMAVLKSTNYTSDYDYLTSCNSNNL